MTLNLTTTFKKICRGYIGNDDGWHIDWALRYKPVVQEILSDRGNSSEVRDLKIIEFGCGSDVGLTTFLARPVVGVDLAFTAPIRLKEKRISPVIASAAQIPFKEERFDVVVSVDMMEHMPPDERYMAFLNMVKLVKKEGRFILSIPCDVHAQESDRETNRAYTAQTGTDHPFLSEHLQHGLPSTCDVLRYFDQAEEETGFSLSLKQIKKLNIHINSLIQKTLNRQIEKKIHYLPRFLLKLFLPVFEKCNRGRSYRKIFVIRRL